MIYNKKAYIVNSLISGDRGIHEPPFQIEDSVHHHALTHGILIEDIEEWEDPYYLFSSSFGFDFTNLEQEAICGECRTKGSISTGNHNRNEFNLLPSMGNGKGNGVVHGYGSRLHGGSSAHLKFGNDKDGNMPAPQKSRAKPRMRPPGVIDDNWQAPPVESKNVRFTLEDLRNFAKARNLKLK
jgi:hypothetical protein